MKKIEAIITPTRVKDVKDALVDIGIEGMTVSEVDGFAQRQTQTGFYRGRQYHVNVVPGAKVELVVTDARFNDALAAIMTAAQILKSGDGKVFVSTVEEAIRIRTEERGCKAL